LMKKTKKDEKKLKSKDLRITSQNLWKKNLLSTLLGMSLCNIVLSIVKHMRLPSLNSSSHYLEGTNRLRIRT
jgi:hypothetical protein